MFSSESISGLPVDVASRNKVFELLSRIDPTPLNPKPLNPKPLNPLPKRPTPKLVRAGFRALLKVWV